mmetsp:Transcript_2466/g.9281  ORF Transcript_2466/g.9281 Transcript_2466/m.9281 type:complete len:638 (-) Transcript_2466:5059-6972(-)
MTSPIFTLTPLPNTSSLFPDTLSISLTNTPQTIGRLASNSHSIADKRISSRHLQFEVDESSIHELFVKDLSTNGAFLNGNRLKKGERVPLKHGDSLTCVVPNATHTMAKELPCWQVTDENHVEDEPQDATLEVALDDTLDLETMTQEIDADGSADVAVGDKRKRDTEDPVTRNEEPPTKVRRVSESSSIQKEPHTGPHTPETQAPEPLPEKTSPTTDSKSTSTKTKKYDAETERLMRLLGASSQDLQQSLGDEDVDTSGGASKDDDAFAEELTCGICSEILYKPISVLPCLHSFCAPCYSQWMDESDNCPHCRKEVELVRRNHILSNLVDKYLQSHQEKKRSDEELKELDEKNTLTDDKLREMENNHSSSSSNNNNTGGFGFPLITPQTSHTTYYGASRPSLQSTGMHLPPQHAAGTTISRTGVITSTNPCKECHTAGSDGFRCNAHQTHICCQACSTFMPLRAGLPLDRKQRCRYCDGFFCNKYYSSSGGCPGTVSNGTFEKLKNHRMMIIPFRAFSANNHERSILTDYMSDKNLSAQDVFNAICDKIDDGSYSTTGRSGAAADVNDICCFNCANTIFKDLVYDYRKDIPSTDLRSSVTVNRPDCWFGSECRTQSRNSSHAQRYNHICENTHGGST